MAYTYFVSYVYEGGVGNVEITVEEPIVAFWQIRHIEELITEPGKPTYRVINFILLTTQEL